jgi:hypothetical protein
MTLVEFQERFHSDHACRDDLFRLPWPDGVRCPRCGRTRGWRRRARPPVTCAQRGDPGFGNGDHFPPQPRAASEVVSGLVLDHRGVCRDTEKLKTVATVDVTPKGPPPLHAKIVNVKDFTQPALIAALQRIAVRTAGWSGSARFGEAGARHAVSPNPPRLIEDRPVPVAHPWIRNAKAWVLGTFHGLGPRSMAAHFAQFCWRFHLRCYGQSLFRRLVKTCLWAAPAMAPVSTAA